MRSQVILLLPLLLTLAAAVPIPNSTVDSHPAAAEQVVAAEDVPQAQVPGIVVDSAPAAEEAAAPQVVAVQEVPASAEVVEVVEAVQGSAEVTTTIPPQTESGERDPRQADDDDEEGNADEDDGDDEEEDDGEDEEEEEERKLPPVAKSGVKSGSKKKVVIPSKPVPVLADGVEDDEAEDLGIFEREEVKSDEKSNEDKSEEDQNDEEDDESGEDDERSERPSGLVAEPSSNERGDTYDAEAPSAAASQNEVNEAERPLAVAVVQREGDDENRESESAPVVIDNLSAPLESQLSQVGVEKVSKPKKTKTKPKKEVVDDDDEDEEDDEDDGDEEEARSEKITKARAAYPSPVLYYYPFPESPVAASKKA